MHFLAFILTSSPPLYMTVSAGKCVKEAIVAMLLWQEMQLGIEKDYYISMPTSAILILLFSHSSITDFPCAHITARIHL